MWRYLVVGLVTFMLLSGCSFKDIDKRLFVIGFGIDKNEDEKEPFHVSLKVTIPSSESGSSLQEEPTILEADGVSMTDAVNKIRSKLDKELDFGHTKIIVFGRDILPKNAKYLSNWFFRREDIQQITFISVADEKAKDVLKVKPKTISQPSYSLIIAFERTGTEQPYIITKYLFQYRREYFDDGVDATLPVVKAKDSEHVINTSVVVKQNGELVNLDKEETKIINMLNEPFHEIDFKIKRNKNLITMRTDNIKSKINVSNSKKTPKVQVSLSLTGQIEESFEPLSKAEVDEVENMLETELKEKVKDLLTKLQKESVDPMGFGIQYRAKQWNDHESAKRWKALYPDVNFEVDTNVRIKSVGTVE